jgi:hypothetical protein
MPRHGWRILARTPKEVDFLRLPRHRSFGSYAVAVRHHRRWSIDTWGDCVAERVVRGYEVVRWRPAERPRARDDSLVVAADTGTCHPGSPRWSHAERRFDHARVRYTKHGVYVLVLFRPEPPPPTNACFGVGLVARVRIHLPTAIGHRALYDARTLPPTRVGRGR